MHNILSENILSGKDESRGSNNNKGDNSHNIELSSENSTSSSWANFILRNDGEIGGIRGMGGIGGMRGMGGIGGIGGMKFNLFCQTKLLVLR